MSPHPADQPRDPHDGYNALAEYVAAWARDNGIPVDRLVRNCKGEAVVVLPIFPAPRRREERGAGASHADVAGAPPASEPPDERGRGISKCRLDIIQLLEEVGKPLTTTRLLAELAKRNMDWSERAVSGHLARMVEDGTLMSGEGMKPPGYRFPPEVE